MARSVIVALVTAGASLLVAIVSLFTAIITSRFSSRTSASIELLRQSLAESSKAKDFADAELLAAVAALRHAMQAVQNVKDEIQLIDASIEDSLESAEAISRIRKARDSLSEIFEAEHPYFNLTEHAALHRAKAISVEAYSVLHKGLRDQKHASLLIPEARQWLGELRFELTDVQSLLRDSRDDRILRRTLGGR